MSEQTRTRTKAVAAAAGPAALFAAFVAHPHLAGRLPNDEAIAAAVAADPTRWGLAHLAAGVASGLLVLAFLAVHSHLRAAGDDRWSGPALAFVVLGSTLYAMLPGMEFAPLAAVRTGADATAAQGALGPWFISVVMTGAVCFAVGVVGFAADIGRSRILDPRAARLVAVALLAMGATRFVPFAMVQFHVQGVAGIVAFWPLALAMWRAASGMPAERVPTATVV